MDHLVPPSLFVTLLINSQGSLAVVGDVDGKPFPTEEAATQFFNDFVEKYPNVQGGSTAIVAASLDADLNEDT